MVILGLETVTRSGSLAWLDGDVCHATTGDPAITHGIRLPGELIAFAAARGRRLSEIDGLVVVSGPGSFTGLRIGLAAIQGVALAMGRRVVPIPTLEALASEWMNQDRGSADWIVTCQDAARGDVYFAAFDVRAPGPHLALKAALPASVAPPAEAAALVAALEPSGRVAVIGDAVAAHGAEFLRAIPGATLVTAPLNLARGAVRLAAGRMDQAVAPHALRPEYVRKPDVELARARAAARPAVRVAIEEVDRPDEIREVAALQARAFAESWGADAMQRDLEGSDVARLFAARTEAGELVGYCSCWIVVDELHINSFAVDPSRRRRGIGRQMLDAVLRRAAAAGATQATLEVRQSNVAARELYEAAGFAVEAVRRDYYRQPPEDGLILWHRHLDRVK